MYAQNLKNYQRSHNKENPKTCTLCNNSLSCSDSLKEHKRSHTGEKPTLVLSVKNHSFDHRVLVRGVTLERNPIFELCVTNHSLAQRI